MYQVEFRPAAWRELKNLGKRMPPADYEVLEASIDALITEPRPRGCCQVTNTPYFRVRAAHAYRIVCQVKDAEQKVVVIRVAKRAEFTYKHLP